MSDDDIRTTDAGLTGQIDTGYLFYQISTPLYLTTTAILGLLNIPVIACHGARSPSPERTLFLALSMCNLLTCYPAGVSYCAVVVYIMLRYHGDPCPKYWELVRVSHCLVISYLGAVGLVIAACLAVRRSLRIMWPFRKVSFSVMMGAGCVTIATVTFTFAFTFWCLFSPVSKMAIITVYVAFGVSFIATIIGNLASISGMYFLFVHHRGGGALTATNQCHRRAITTLFALNLPYTVQLLLSAIYVSKLSGGMPRGFDIFRELHFITGTITIAGLTPLILLLRNPGYRTQTRTRCEKLRSTCRTTCTTVKEIFMNPG